MATKSYGSDPATLHYAVTPSNTTPLSPTPRALYALSDGDIVIADSANVVVTYTVTAGTTIPFRAIRILTSSTANVVAWV